MRYRLLLALAFVATLAVPILTAQAQAVVKAEAMTIAASSTPFAAATLAALTNPNASCQGVVETAPFRFTLDGTTTPSASVGVLAQVGQQVTINGLLNIQHFAGFRTTGTSATIYWSCAQ